MKTTSFVVAAAVLLVSAISHASENAAPARARAGRVDFDDQLVQGQVNKGAVHLIERRDADLGSLVKVRTGYRKEILGDSARSRRVITQRKALVLPKRKR